MYKSKFDRITIHNRWKRPRWDRSGSWLIIGVYKYKYSAEEYGYFIGAFGITVYIWIKRVLITNKLKRHESKYNL